MGAGPSISTLLDRPLVLRVKFSGKSLFPAACAAVLSALAACSPNVDQRGNLPENDKLAAIQPGTTTKDQVVKILGTPSSTGIFNDKTWYYISKKTSQLAFFDPEVLDQQVYILRFDDKGVVRTVDHRDLKDGRPIEPAPGATPAPGRELTFLEQVLGNVGRFNSSSSSSSGGSDSQGRQGGPNPQDRP
jgi:outer membrane protein assembly factor BamE (lipoprotein component of BamABCDE complex)